MELAMQHQKHIIMITSFHHISHILKRTQIATANDIGSRY